MEPMEIAKVSANGQITIPLEIRNLLGLNTGDKVLFARNRNGDIIVDNASSEAIRDAQRSFRGVARKLRVKNEDDVQRLVDEVRYQRDVR